METTHLTQLLGRVAVCGALLFAISAAVLTAARAAEKSAASSDAARALLGTWVYVGEPGKVGEPPAKGGFVKHRTDRHWVAVSVDGRSSYVTSTHGGTWRVNGNVYEETVEYGGDYQASLIGKTYHWTITLEGDLMIKKGTDNPWHEVWRRVK